MSPSLLTVESILTDYDLKLDDEVEVELLVTIATGALNGNLDSRPRLVEGKVTGATGAVLILDANAGRYRNVRPTRIPWAAIALIRDRVTTAPHPGL